MATKRERREARRAAAREQREQELKRQQRSKRLRTGLLILIPALIVAVAVWVIVGTNSQKTGPAPDGASAEGGIVLQAPDTLQPGVLDTVDLDDLPEPQDPTTATGPPPGAEEATDGEPVNVVIYGDPNCVHCAEFDKSYRGVLINALQNGEITLEYRLVGYLDYASRTNYSSRAANAAACVADQNPGAYLPYMSAIYDSYGEELSNDQLVSIGQEHGVDISDCVEDDTFRPFVKHTTDHALAAPVGGTPSVWVDGKDWSQSGQDFTRFLAEALNN